MLQGDISETSFEIYVNKCISILDIEFDEFTFQCEKEVATTITDEEKKKNFLDFSNGYLAQIRKWISENVITKTSYEFALGNNADSAKTQTEFDNTDSQSTWETIKIWVVKFFQKVLELLKRFWNWLTGKGNKGAAEVSEEQKTYVKDDFKTAVHEDLDEWLSKAEEENNRIINQFV